MKLIQRNNRNFIFAGLMVLPIAAIILHFGLSYFLHTEIDEQLILDEIRVVEQLKSKNQVFSISPIIEIGKSLKTNESRVIISDIEVFDPLEKENEPFRQLKSTRKINGEYYEITIRHSTIENEDVLFIIGLTMLIVLILVISVLYLYTNWASKKMWKPFYKNLDTLKSFSLEEKSKPIFVESNIEEFNSLSTSLRELTIKIQNDYDNLKEFTENASHEIQTPLTVISMNLEEMLQEDLSEANYGKLYSILKSTQKLSKLNEKLLLLSKLENNQFQKIEEVNITELVLLKLEELKPILDDNELKVELSINNNFISVTDQFLVNLLVTNILSNAIKHNNQSKLIRIISETDEIIFQNSTDGSPDLEKIFNRFNKHTTAENSVGLGLSIVKKVAELSKLKLSVIQRANLFEIGLNKKGLS